MMMFIALFGLASASSAQPIQWKNDQCPNNLDNMMNDWHYDALTENPVSGMCAIFEYGYVVKPMNEESPNFISFNEWTKVNDWINNEEKIENDLTLDHYVGGDFGKIQWDLMEEHYNAGEQYFHDKDMTINFDLIKEYISSKHHHSMNTCKDQPMQHICRYIKSDKVCRGALSDIKQKENPNADSVEDVCKIARNSVAFNDLSMTLGNADQWVSDKKSLKYANEVCHMYSMKHICDTYKNIPRCSSALSSMKQKIDTRRSLEQSDVKNPVEVMCHIMMPRQKRKMTFGENKKEFLDMLATHLNKNKDMVDMKYMKDMQSCKMTSLKNICHMYKGLAVCEAGDHFYDAENDVCFPCKGKFIGGCEECKKQCTGARKM